MSPGRSLTTQRQVCSLGCGHSRRCSGIPAPARLEIVSYLGDSLIAGKGDWAAEERLSTDGARQMDTWQGGESKADGVSEAEAPVMMGKRLSDLAAARLEPHLWRLQVCCSVRPDVSCVLMHAAVDVLACALGKGHPAVIWAPAFAAGCGSHLSTISFLHLWLNPERHPVPCRWNTAASRSRWIGQAGREQGPVQLWSPAPGARR